VDFAGASILDAIHHPIGHRTQRQHAVESLRERGHLLAVDAGDCFDALESLHPLRSGETVTVCHRPVPPRRTRPLLAQDAAASMVGTHSVLLVASVSTRSTLAFADTTMPCIL